MSFRVFFFGWKVAVLMLYTYVIVFICRILSTVCIFHLLTYTYGSLWCTLHSALLLPHYRNGFAEVTVTSQWGTFQAFPWLLCCIRRYWLTLLKFPIPCLPKRCRIRVLFLLIHFLSLMVFLSLPSLPFLTFPTGTTKILFLFHFCILTLTDQSHLDSFLYADDF